MIEDKISHLAILFEGSWKNLWIYKGTFFVLNVYRTFENVGFLIVEQFVKHEKLFTATSVQQTRGSRTFDKYLIYRGHSNPLQGYFLGKPTL